MKRKVDIIYFGDILDVNGINFVTNSFLLGKEYFIENDLILNKIYSSSSQIDCSRLDKIPIGRDINTQKYKFTRIIRTVAKKILDSRIPAFAWFKFSSNYIKPAQKVISDNALNFDGDYVIFQDFITAYYYYKNTEIDHKKSLLILHTSEDMFTQFKILYPGIFKSAYKDSMYLMMDFVKEKVDKIVYVSEKSAIKNRSFAKHVVYIHNGLPDLDQLIIKDDSDFLNFVCIGSINYNKGQDIIIEAINLISDDVKKKVKFFFIGDGPQLPELKKSVKDFNLEGIIEFLGLRNDVPDLLEKMDVLLLPSKTEGLPLCIIEGLRQGLYIVATDVGGISEMISEDFGILIKRDKKELKNAVERLVLERKVNRSGRNASRLYYEEKFTLKMMINKYSKELKSI